MKFEENGNTITCVFDARLDTTACTEIASELDSEIGAAMRKNPELEIEFDLERTEYLCSAFLRLCILYGKQVGLSRFRITHVSSSIREVFHIAGLTSIMTIDSTGRAD